MSGQVIFARGSADRKTAYQMLTLIRKVEDGLVVSKKAAHPAATEHMRSFQDKYEMLLRSGAKCSFAKIIPSGPDETAFEFIGGESLQSLLETCIEKNNLAGIKINIRQSLQAY